jgi:hypothetical protein
VVLPLLIIFLPGATAIAVASVAAPADPDPAAGIGLLPSCAFGNSINVIS